MPKNISETISINTENKNLKNIVNNIETSEEILTKKNLEKYKKDKQKLKKLEKKPKKLPSINLMKTKTIRFIKKRRDILLSEIKKNKKNYFFVIENISKMRDETRLFKDLKNKKPLDVKDLYLKFFGHIHGLNKK